MGDKSSDERLVESLRSLLSSDSFKIEPPTVMASSTKLRVRVNVDTLLKLVYDLITRGESQGERLGVRYEEKSTQTKANPPLSRGTKGAQPLVSQAAASDDTSEIEKRELLEYQNGVLTRSLIQCHAQYTEHKKRCTSCPPLTFPQELCDMHQQFKAPPPASPKDSHNLTIPPSPPPLPPIRMPAMTQSTSLVPTAMDIGDDQPSGSHLQTPDPPRPSPPADSAHSISFERSISPTPLFSDKASLISRPSPTTTTTENPIDATLPRRHTSVQSIYSEPSLTPKVEPEDVVIILDEPESPGVPQGDHTREASLPTNLKREPEDESMLVIEVPDSPVAPASSASDYMISLDPSDNEHDDTSDLPVLDPSEVWWRDEVTELVFNRFLPGTRLLECRMCETRPNPSYKSFSDDDENLNTAIQIHFEKEHPEESYVLKRCTNALLKDFMVFR